MQFDVHEAAGQALIFTFSPALATTPHLSRFLDAPVAVAFPLRPPRDATIVGWGRKRSYQWAARYAAFHGIRCLGLEDGFLRSVGFGRQEPPLSIVMDDVGMYYDAGGPSRLEGMIASAALDDAQRQRAQALMSRWRQGRLSKYNHARDVSAELPEHFVLVVDQTRNDASIRFGMADASSFQRMLTAALDEHPHSTILLKVHPEVFAGRKQGNFDRMTPGQALRVQLLGEDVHPASLLERAGAVYVVTSQMGFEGLLWGKPVRTFGMPFYAGWSLTQDDLAAPDRRRPASLEALVHAALVDYPRYVDPESGQRCEVERVMNYLVFQRGMRQRFPAEVHAVGFGRLRRPMARAYFAGSRIHYHDTGDTVPANSTAAVWGRDPVRHTLPATARVIYLEDGFLRSVGLGAELVQPLSLVMDRVGIYYDATRPSELEQLLEESRCDAPLLERAACLRRRIVEVGITKYNMGGEGWIRPPGAGRVILVPGQVERDASIRYGAPGLRTNLELLKGVRGANPDAWVLYKPHPDVQAGLRHGGVGEEAVLAHCDAVVLDVPMDSLLQQVDEVHVLTSLAGFEALLRGKRVVTYGQPFYASWGLTTDLQPLARRSRRLTVDELVAGVLILYPTYVSRVTGKFTTVEQCLDELAVWREHSARPLPVWRRFGRHLRRLAIALHNRMTGAA